MLYLLFASILAGSVLCAFEFIYIVVTCGPFWMGPGILIKTWLIYSCVVFAGLFLLNLLIGLIPPLRRRLADSLIRFRLFTAISILGYGALLAALILKIKSLGIGISAGSYLIAGLVWLCGVLVLYLTFKIINTAGKIPIRSSFLSALFLLLAMGFCLCSDMYYASVVRERSIAHSGAVPHVALIVLDTTRGDHLSCYGYPFNTSPNFDRMASEGLLCQNAFSASNWTPPGHISAFTGKYPSQHGNDGQPFMPDNLVSMAEILNQRGYFCVALTNNRFSGKYINLTQGFDSDNWVWLNEWVQPGWTLLWDQFIHKDRGSKVTFPIALKTLKWIENKGGHLFLYINVMEPHLEYSIHEPFFSEFTASLSFDDIPNMSEVLDFCNTRGIVTYDSAYFQSYNDASLQYIRAAYDSEIACMDHHFGVFSEGAREAGLLDKTLLVITSDHGEFLGDHFTKDHPAMMFDSAIRVPLIMRYPDNIPCMKMNELASNVDILPTTLNLMGIPEAIPEDIEGIDLFGGKLQTRRWLMSENNNCTHQDDTPQGGCYSLFDENYKVMLNNDPLFLKQFPFDTLLLDLKLDPDELEDLHGALPGKCDSMLVRLSEWIERIRVEPEVQFEVDAEVTRNLKALGYVN